MRNWLRHKAINFLFWLLGGTKSITDDLSLITMGKPAVTPLTRRNWQRALANAWENKHLMEFLRYQAECDKENAWSGRVNRETTQGSRIRTLFIMYQAQRSHLMQRQGKQQRPDDKATLKRETEALDKSYKKAVEK